VAIALESPEYVRTSFAGALSLGLERGRFVDGVRCGCLNLLLTYDDGCRARCSYCGLGAGRAADEGGQTFIRVRWPVHALDDILARAAGCDSFGRVCVSMLTHPRARADTLAVIGRCRDALDLPISALVAPTLLRERDDFVALRDAGADRVGVAIDAATPELFDRHRGAGVGGPHRWERYWHALDDALAVFGRGHASIHAMVGLGETEEQVLDLMARAQALGAAVHLFSFCAEAGSVLQDQPPPPLDRYRRLQVARHLLERGVVERADIRCDADGGIVDLGVDPAGVPDIAAAFVTSGCPGRDGAPACNRPFGNERPSGPWRNHPMLPDDPASLVAELELPGVPR
jgi:biotin synthase-related radical SAM superfamily protein